MIAAIEIGERCRCRGRSDGLGCRHRRPCAVRHEIAGGRLSRRYGTPTCANCRAALGDSAETIAQAEQQQSTAESAPALEPVAAQPPWWTRY